ncbi:MAG: hypothetical protein R2819_05030 [Allomuricauda sp.]
MLKTIAFPFIAVLLIFSLLAPSIVTLLDKDSNIAFFMSPEEEEKKNEKESEKKIDGKNLFLTHFVSSDHFVSQERDLASSGYLPSVLDYEADILVPPPRRLV